MSMTKSMVVDGLRRKAVHFFNLQSKERRARRQSWNRWKAKKGDSVTEELMFEEIPQVQWSVNNEQEYQRLAQLHATMAIMEMLNMLLDRLSPVEVNSEE